jgi:hypothetical protein
LNVVAICSTPKDVRVSCDDKVVKLSYIIIECVLVSMFKDVLLDVNVLKCVSLRYNVWLVWRLSSKKTSILCQSNDLILRE